MIIVTILVLINKCVVIQYYYVFIEITRILYDKFSLEAFFTVLLYFIIEVICIKSNNVANNYDFEYIELNSLIIMY